jgi:hypothetical protein
MMIPMTYQVWSVEGGIGQRTEEIGTDLTLTLSEEDRHMLA